ncbi:MAG: radical SAM protein [bacterium]
MSAYSLLPHCRLVLGAKRAAIYNLARGEVYSVDAVGRKILLGERVGDDLWEQLCDAGLAKRGRGPNQTEHEDRVLNQLRYLWLEITGNCNLACIHCYGSFCPKRKVPDLPVEFWLEILKEGYQLGCRKVQFVGGEPLKYKGLRTLLDTAHKMGYPFVEVFTNGTLITEAYCQLFAKLGTRVAVSLYSAVPEVHNEITGNRHSFDKTARALARLRQAGVTTSVALVVMRQNQHTVEQTISFAEASGFGFEGPRIIKGIGRGGNSALYPDSDVVERWATRKKPRFRTDLGLFTRYQICNPCWGRELAISSEGLALPCVFARNMPVGDLKTEKLKDVLEAQELARLRALTKDKIDVCRDCEYRYACGDCRVLALEQSGDLYAKTPFCNYDPYTGIWA